MKPPALWQRFKRWLNRPSSPDTVFVYRDHNEPLSSDNDSTGAYDPLLGAAVESVIESLVDAVCSNDGSVANSIPDADPQPEPDNAPIELEAPDNAQHPDTGMVNHDSQNFS